MAAVASGVTSVDDLAALATQATDIQASADALAADALAGNLAATDLLDGGLDLAGDAATLTGATDLAANLDASADLATLGLDTL